MDTKTVETAHDGGSDAAPPTVRIITAADLDWALKEGWSDFKEKRGDILLIPFIYTVVGFLASVFAFNSQLFPLIFPLAAGFALVGPIAAAGFYELARRREARIDASWWHFLDPLKGRSRLPLAALAVGIGNAANPEPPTESTICLPSACCTLSADESGAPPCPPRWGSLLT